MSTYNLDLYFAGGPEAPGPVAYVRVQTSVGDRTGTQRLISHQCVSAQEFSAEIRRLHAELDEIEQEGLRRFRQVDAEIGASR